MPHLPAFGGSSEANQDSGDASLPSLWLWLIVSGAVLVTGIIVAVVLVLRSRWMVEYEYDTVTEGEPPPTELTSVSAGRDFELDFSNPMCESEGGDTVDPLEFPNEDEGLRTSAGDQT
jgi:hypothetical protein